MAWAWLWNEPLGRRITQQLLIWLQNPLVQISIISSLLGAEKQGSHPQLFIKATAGPYETQEEPVTGLLILPHLGFCPLTETTDAFDHVCGS